MRGIKIKDKLYDYFVRKNEYVQYEYERYVREHIEEHRLHRWTHIKLLIKLNWFYRVKKNNTPYMYWDNPADKEIKKTKITKITEMKNTNFKEPTENKNVKWKGTAFVGAESSEEIKKKNLRPSLSRIMYIFRNVKLVSFDIFDTLLLRPFSDPKDLFYILGDKFDELDFYNLRIRCEKEARDIKEQIFGNREVTIYDIYNRINYYTGIDIEYGVTTELETEMDLIYANEYVKYIYYSFINNNIPVILVSDMYYPQDIIEKILEKNGIKGYEKLYVSCDYNCSKANGGLWEKVIEDYNNIPAENINIIDDNYKIILKAREMGIKAFHYARNAGLSIKFRPSYLSAMVGSAYKGVIANYINANENRYSVPYEFGFIYGGILLLGYCSYIHEDCLKNKVEKVCFVSRDGDIIKQVWDFLYDDIPSEYLLISRSCVTRLSVEVWKKMFIECVVDRMSTKQKSLSIMEILNLNELTFLENDLYKFGLNADMIISKNENSDTVSKFRDFIQSHIDDIKKVYRESNEIYINYISTLISDVKEKIAIADVGWRGSGGITISKVMNKINPHIKVTNYLLGGRQPVNLPQIRKGEIKCFLFSAEDNYSALGRHEDKTNYFYELLLMSCTPLFKYFYYANGKIKMKCGNVDIINYNIVKEIQRGELDFVKEYTKRFKKYPSFYRIPASDITHILYNVMSKEEYFIKYFSEISYSPEIGMENIKFIDWIK